MRRKLPKGIEQAAGKPKRKRLTTIGRWSKSTLEKACKQMGREWDALEESATQAQGKPDFND